MAKQADDEPSPTRVQRKVEPAFKLPPIGTLPPPSPGVAEGVRRQAEELAQLKARWPPSPSLPPEEIERLRRQGEEYRRFVERLPKADPAKADRLAEGRRLLDRDMAIADGLIAPPWLERLMKQLMGRAPPVAAPPPPEPNADTPVESSSTESRTDAERRSPKAERQSRHGVRYAGAASKRALVVLKRMYPDYAYPTKSEVSDTDLWESFVEEWNRVEGAKGLSLNLRPSPSTVLRIVGRKD
jgi:hypothetical protein